MMMPSFRSGRACYWRNHPWQRLKTQAANLLRAAVLLARLVWRVPERALRAEYLRRVSEGVVGQGRALYAAALAIAHEGVVAKHLASAYRPGKRSAAWRKIKPRC
jgi:ATP-dependent DNA ligase